MAVVCEALHDLFGIRFILIRMMVFAVFVGCIPGRCGADVLMKKRFDIKDEKTVKPTGIVYRHVNDGVATGLEMLQS